MDSFPQLLEPSVLARTGFRERASARRCYFGFADMRAPPSRPYIQSALEGRPETSAFPVPNLTETEFNPYLSEFRRVEASAQNLSASDLEIFRSLPPRKDRNTDELRQASLRSQSRRARLARVCRPVWAPSAAWIAKTLLTAAPQTP